MNRSQWAWLVAAAVLFGPAAVVAIGEATERKAPAAPCEANSRITIEVEGEDVEKGLDKAARATESALDRAARIVEESLIRASEATNRALQKADESVEKALRQADEAMKEADRPSDAESQDHP